MNRKTIDNRFHSAARSCQTTSWALLRILAAAMFLTHGWDKLFGPDPQPLTGGMGLFGIDVGLNMLFVAGLIEFFGSLFLILGLFTRYFAALAALLMVMAYIHAHPAWFPTLNNGELATMYFLAWFALFAWGAGRFSLDYRLFGRT